MLVILRIIFAPLLIIILSRTGYPFFIQDSADFQRTHSLHTHIKDTLYNRCGLGIDNRQMIRLIAPVVTVGDFAAEILASFALTSNTALIFLLVELLCHSLNKLMIGIMSSAVLLRSAVSTPSLIAMKRI